ncbi:MAG TPA: DUF2934 domain-containing protein [Sedimentisphaerales bacterium]|nr:DUF2934 domain-containing protein [Sedimentisphaerales bacterium]
MAKSSKKSVPSTRCGSSSGCASGTAVATAPRPTGAVASRAGEVMPTYEQIAQRAAEIWKKKGCLPGQDEQNWLEAERQLKAEFPRK